MKNERYQTVQKEQLHFMGSEKATKDLQHVCEIIYTIWSCLL